MPTVVHNVLMLRQWSNEFDSHVLYQFAPLLHECVQVRCEESKLSPIVCVHKSLCMHRGMQHMSPLSLFLFTFLRY